MKLKLDNNIYKFEKDEITQDNIENIPKVVIG
jgi:hypothetical protein